MYFPRPYEYPFVLPRASLRYGLSNSLARMPIRIGSSPRLTARELAVLRMVSMGQQSSDVAKALGLGEETVRGHLKRRRQSSEFTIEHTPPVMRCAST